MAAPPARPLTAWLPLPGIDPPDWAEALCRAAEHHPVMRARLRGWPWATRWTFDGEGPHLRWARTDADLHRPLRPRAGIGCELVLVAEGAWLRLHPELGDSLELVRLADAIIQRLPR